MDMGCTLLEEVQEEYNMNSAADEEDCGRESPAGHLFYSSSRIERARARDLQRPRVPKAPVITFS